MNLSPEHLQKILQASISPVALISGVGLLILSMTNRFARVTDRLRELSETASENTRHASQSRIFLRRARLLRTSISCSVASVLGASVMVLLLFFATLFGAPVRELALVIFGVSLVLLIVSLIYFLLDMNLSLRAIEEHIGEK
jgi:hypothetical protein